VKIEPSSSSPSLSDEVDGEAGLFPTVFHSVSFQLRFETPINVHKPICLLIGQSERYNFVGSLPPKIASPACGNHYKLFAALLSYIRSWRSVRAGGQLCYP
jgi:hypothetical protein